MVRIEEGWSAFKFLTRKASGKKRLRPRHRWEDNIKSGVKEIGVNIMNSVNLADFKNRSRYQQLKKES